MFNTAYPSLMAPTPIIHSTIAYTPVAYVQGMRQAHRDWTTLLTFVRTALQVR